MQVTAHSAKFLYVGPVKMVKLTMAAYAIWHTVMTYCLFNADMHTPGARLCNTLESANLNSHQVTPLHAVRFVNTGVESAAGERHSRAMINQW